MMEVVVKDSFDIKGRVALEYGASGVVAVFGLDPMCDDLPSPGKPMLIVRPDGWMFRAVMGEVKDHGPAAKSFFVKGLTREQLPIGSRLLWGRALSSQPLDALVSSH